MCNMDCFNCVLPDCTNNSMETRKEKNMRTIAERTTKQQYYCDNREEILARQKKYYDEHKAERSAYYKEYYKKHRKELIKRECARVKRKRKYDKEWRERQNELARARYWRKRETVNTD